MPEQIVNAFAGNSWVKLVDVLLAFKEDLANNTSHASKKREWNRRCFEGARNEMREIENVLVSPDASPDLRWKTANRLVGAKVTSLKIKKNDGFEGYDGVVVAAHDGAFDDQDRFVYLPHVTVNLGDEIGRVRHRLEDVRLIKEPWWYSDTRHK